MVVLWGRVRARIALYPLSLGHRGGHSLTWPEMAAGGCPQAGQPGPVKPHHGHPAKTGCAGRTAEHQQHGSPTGRMANTTHAGGDPSPGSPFCALHLV